MNQVTDALAYSNKMEIDLYDKLADKQFAILYPIIVIDGKLFSARIEPNGNIELRESNHLQLKVLKAFDEPITVEESKGDYILSTKPVIIDIVLKDYFNEFLKVFS